MSNSHDFVELSLGFYASLLRSFPTGSPFTLVQELILLSAEPTKLFPFHFL